MKRIEVHAAIKTGLEKTKLQQIAFQESEAQAYSTSPCSRRTCDLQLQLVVYTSKYTCIFYFDKYCGVETAVALKTQHIKFSMDNTYTIRYTMSRLHRPKPYCLVLIERRRLAHTNQSSLRTRPSVPRPRSRSVASRVRSHEHTKLLKFSIIEARGRAMLAYRRPIRWAAPRGPTAEPRAERSSTDRGARSAKLKSTKIIIIKKSQQAGRRGKRRR